ADRSLAAAGVTWTEENSAFVVGLVVTSREVNLRWLPDGDAAPKASARAACSRVPSPAAEIAALRAVTRAGRSAGGAPVSTRVKGSAPLSTPATTVSWAVTAGKVARLPPRLKPRSAKVRALGRVRAMSREPALTTLGAYKDERPFMLRLRNRSL